MQFTLRWVFTICMVLPAAFAQGQTMLIDNHEVADNLPVALIDSITFTHEGETGVHSLSFINALTLHPSLDDGLFYNGWTALHVLDVNGDGVEGVVAAVHPIAQARQFGAGPTTPSDMAGWITVPLLISSVSWGAPIEASAGLIGVGEERIGEEATLNLALSDGFVALMTDLRHHFYPSNPGFPAVFLVEAHVNNGGGHPVNGETIQFSSSHGAFYSVPLPDPDYLNSVCVTGDRGEQGYPDLPDGRARRYLLVEFEEAFPDPSALATHVQVEAVVEGEDELVPEPILLRLTHSLLQ